MLTSVYETIAEPAVGEVLFAANILSEQLPMPDQRDVS